MLLKRTLCEGGSPEPKPPSLGKLVAYEAKVEANGKKQEIQGGLEGKALDHEE